MDVPEPLDDEPTAIYLRGKSAGLRAPLRDDAGSVNAWHEGPQSLSPDEAEALLQKEERMPWGTNPTIRLMIIDTASGDVVGSIVAARSAQRMCKLTVTVDARHPEKDLIEHEVIRLVVPWLLDELGLMVVTMTFPEDATALVSAATAVGLSEVVRLREFVRQGDHQIDLLTYERVNWEWGRRPRDRSNA